MNFNYSIPLNALIDNDGYPLQTIPELIYGNRLEVSFSARDVDNIAIDLSSAVSWRLAIDADRNSSTGTLCGTDDIVYNRGNRTLNCFLNTRTLRYLNAVDGKDNYSLIAEMTGFDSSGNCIFRFSWNMLGVMPVNADDEVPVPEPLPIAYRDYTSFRVFASDTTFSAGAIASKTAVEKALLQSVYGEWVIDKSLHEPIPAGKTETFLIRALKTVDDCDLIVDWGDGMCYALRDGIPIGCEDRLVCVPDGNGNIYNITVSHTYSVGGVYLVKIYGCNLYGLWHGSVITPENTGGVFNNPASLVCDVLSGECRIADCICNAASMYLDSIRLLHISSPYLSPLRNVSNAASMFQRCKNLYSVDGLSCRDDSILNNMFSGCVNLHSIASNIFPYRAQSIRGMFDGCQNLILDVGRLLGRGAGVNGCDVEIAFRGCSSLLGTFAENRLWNDTFSEFTQTIVPDNAGSNTRGMFYLTNEYIRNQVPKSWGGLH